MQKSEEFSNKCILISGAAGVVGQDLTKKLAQENATLILVDLPQNINILKDMKQELASRTKIVYYGIDICNEEDITVLIKKIEEENLEVDILINAVGVNNLIPARLIKESEWDGVIDTRPCLKNKSCTNGYDLVNY